MKINSNYNNLQESYLFSTIAKKLAAYTEAHPDADIIKMGIGDVTRPLCKVAVDAMTKAVEEMGEEQSFHGYGPEQGYDFLRNAIKEYYSKRSVVLEASEIFVGDGAKSDIGNILDLFDKDNTVLIPNPVYPVYVDTNIMDGRKIVYMNGSKENGFLPMPDDSVKADLIYLCSPNNPTGAVYNYNQLSKWVDYANANDAVIIFDAAYESFITEDLPHSIYEIKGAEKCAIEFCSFSKTAGFTGTRCGYTVLPMALVKGGATLNRMWNRRQTTKFNGVNYVVQRGAASIFTEEGQKEVKETIAYYQNNAKVMMKAFDEMGIWYTGGVNSPYIWFKVPEGKTSWEFFDYLLDNAKIVSTPGSGFGDTGEGFIRLTAFGNKDKTAEAMDRLKKIMK